MNDPKDIVLLTGATGYVGGRLIKALEQHGAQVRCLARRPEALVGRVGPDTEVVRGDVVDRASLAEAMQGVKTAYYLVHALGATSDFEQTEALGARNFAETARDAGVSRVIYVGGLTSETVPKSPHMRSRARVGQILRHCGVETVEFRASVIIGAGSLSYELIRSLVRRLPVMITPKWVSVEAQPIAISDVVRYAVGALDLPPGPHRVYEIGGAERVTYRGLMEAYAEMRGLRRIFIRIPLLTPWLSSLWLHLVTPVFARVGRKLIDSITSPSVVTDTQALVDFPFQPQNLDSALREAMEEEDRQFAETHWTDALSSTGPRRQWGGVRFGSRIVDSRELTVPVPVEAAFAPIRRIGGTTGWYWGNGLWQLRGVMDRAVGGVGMQRGRRDPDHLRVGDVVDCWRVEAYEAPHRLLLAAEMRLPGRAWLQFEVTPEGEGAHIRQTATYDPVGLLGLAYWYALYPLHEFVFAGMLRGIGEAARQEEPKQP